MMGLMYPYVIGGGALALIAAAGGGFTFGTRYAYGQDATAQNKALTAAIADRDSKQKTIDALEIVATARDQTRQATVREITREIPTIIRDPVYRNVCVTDAGVRALDRAAAAANGVDSGAAAGATAPNPVAADHH